MNQIMMLHARRAAGMGELGFNPPGWDFGGGTPSPSGGRWWEPLANIGAQFGNRFLQAWENRGVARSGVNPYFAPPQQPNFNPNVPAADPGAKAKDDGDDSGIGIRFTDKGLRLGEETTVSYPTIMLGVVALVFLQSRPFGRK